LKTEVLIEKCDYPFCVIHAEENTTAIQNIADKITMMDSNGKSLNFNGWDGDFCIQLKPKDVYRIYSMDKKVYITNEKETLLLKLRLYEVEAFLQQEGLDSFIRISNTDIVNFNNVQKLDMSLTGVIKVILNNGESIMVSRRYMSKIRSELCLKK